MQLDWQQMAVFGIVALAALYLTRGYFSKRKKAGCGGCEACPTASEAESGAKTPPQLVQLEVPQRRPSPRGVAGPE